MLISKKIIKKRLRPLSPLKNINAKCPYSVTGIQPDAFSDRSLQLKKIKLFKYIMLVEYEGYQFALTTQKENN